MNKAVIWVLVLPLFVPGPASGQAGASAAPAGTPAALIEQIEGYLQGGNMAGYLDTFAPDVRAAERARLEVFFDDLQMTRVTMRKAGIQTAADGTARAFLQAFFENEYAAVLQSWTLFLQKGEGGWSVVRLDATGTITRLFKLHIPGERAERARRVEVTHTDIRFAFTDAAVFYDNIPGLETALVVIGRGRVLFAPADANEKHQLDLLYKKDRIEDAVDSLYVRGSPGFFASNVRIETAAGLPEVTAVERDRAVAVFARNYPRSFTIESSIDKNLLSFLPQGDEAVLEFKARKAGELVYIYSPFSSDEVSLFDHGKDRTVCLYGPNPSSDPALKRMFISFEEKFDVLSYALDLSYSPTTSFLSAKARIEVLPKVDRLESLKFRFASDLEILKITDAENRELFYTLDKLRETLYVYLISPPVERAPTTIEVFYRGRIKPVAPTTDVVLQGGLNQPIRITPRYETLFFSHAGFWYPGPPEEDYFLARLTLVVPPEYEVVAGGEMVAKSRWDTTDDVAAIEKAGNSVYTFASGSPVKYMAFIVGKFDRKRERAGPVPVATYVSTEVLDSRPGIVDEAAAILDFYGRTFGPYPYEKLGIVLRLWPSLGGNSPASFLVLNEVPWLGDTGFPMPVNTPVDLSSWEEYLLAHEIAHQWWGQGVSFDSFKDQWLSEGLSQFAAASYLRHRYGEAAFAAILRKFNRWTVKKSFRGPVVMGSRLSHLDYEAYQAIVYDKAALALFMLQDLIGREAFEAGLRSFFERCKFRAARTAEFIAAMEAASGRDLKAFFQGWFSSWELPEVRTVWTETAVPDGVRLDLRVTQLKGRFVFPLWIEWSRQGKTGRKMIVVDDTAEEASFVLPRRPEKIRVNPDRAVPGRFLF